MALLAGFLMLWLKKCVVPTLPHEAVSIDVVYPAVMLAYGRPIGLLPAMVSCLQSGLRVLNSSFCRVETLDTVDEAGEPIKKTLIPRVELPYTYLVAWFVLHCPALMTAPYPAPTDGFIPFVQWLENSAWNGGYMATIWKIMQSSMNYQIYRCFLEIEYGNYGDQFADIADPDGFTKLPSGVFWWLVNIRPGYLVFHQGNICCIEPYMPNMFPRQFGYDQLYVGNPSPLLKFMGNPFDGARAWYYFVVGGTGVKFTLPEKTPNSYATLGFYT
jgi:hypothetical protein